MLEAVLSDRLLPMLRHPSWSGWLDAASRGLVDGCEDLTPAPPRVGYVEEEGDDGRRVRFLTTQAFVAAGLTRGDVERRALENLTKRKAKWRVAEKRGGFLGIFGGKPLLLEHVDDLGSERLLDGAFLAKAHTLLDTKRIFVATPVRGMIVAAAATDDDDVATRAFILRVEATFTSAPRDVEPLSAAVLLVEGGVPKSAVKRRREPIPKAGFPFVTLEQALEDMPLPSAEELGSRRRPERPARPARAPLDKKTPPAPPDPNGPGLPVPPVEEDGPALRLLGYVPSARRLEYGCWLVRGQTIPAAELEAIAAIARAHRSPDGRPVDTIRVELLSPALVESVGAPLRALGCETVVAPDGD
jgi:hypothetical protein